MKIFRTSVGRARGLGAAHEGLGHWTAQRLSAIALVPLTFWFVAAVIRLAGVDYVTLKAWFANPGNATLLSLFVFTGFFHAQLGLQVVIEDYVHKVCVKTVSLIAIKLVSVLLGVYSVVSIFKIAFGG